MRLPRSRNRGRTQRLSVREYCFMRNIARPLNLNMKHVYYRSRYYRQAKSLASSVTSLFGQELIPNGLYRHVVRHNHQWIGEGIILFFCFLSVSSHRGCVCVCVCVCASVLFELAIPFLLLLSPRCCRPSSSLLLSLPSRLFLFLFLSLVRISIYPPLDSTTGENDDDAVYDHFILSLFFFSFSVYVQSAKRIEERTRKGRLKEENHHFQPNGSQCENVC